ncbi:hypothetical protein BDK51DRAFT_49917, partial [Blyttiomyces helicus]
MPVPGGPGAPSAEYYEDLTSLGIGVGRRNEVQAQAAQRRSRRFDEDTMMPAASSAGKLNVRFAYFPGLRTDKGVMIKCRVFCDMQTRSQAQQSVAEVFWVSQAYPYPSLSPLPLPSPALIPVQPSRRRFFDFLDYNPSVREAYDDPSVFVDGLSKVLIVDAAIPKDIKELLKDGDSDVLNLFSSWFATVFPARAHEYHILRFLIHFATSNFSARLRSSTRLYRAPTFPEATEFRRWIDKSKQDFRSSMSTTPTIVSWVATFTSLAEDPAATVCYVWRTLERLRDQAIVVFNTHVLPVLGDVASASEARLAEREQRVEQEHRKEVGALREELEAAKSALTIQHREFLDVRSKLNVAELELAELRVDSGLHAYGSGLTPESIAASAGDLYITLHSFLVSAVAPSDLTDPKNALSVLIPSNSCFPSKKMHVVYALESLMSELIASLLVLDVCDLKAPGRLLRSLSMA